MSTAVLTRTVAAEWLRLRTVRATWWFLAAAAVTMLGIATLAGLDVRSGTESGSAWVIGYLTTMPAQFAFFGVVLLAVTADYSTGGIVPTLQWTPRRITLCVARALVPTLVAAFSAVSLAAASALIVRLVAPRFTLTFDRGVEVLGTIGLVVGAGSLIAAGLGFLVCSTAGGLVSVFLVMLVLPLLLPQFGYDWMLDLAQLLPGFATAHLLLGEAEGMTTTSAIVVLTVWSIGALGLGAIRLLTRDADG